MRISYDTTHEILKEVKPTQAPAAASSKIPTASSKIPAASSNIPAATSKKNSGPTPAEIKKATRIINNVTKSMGDDDEEAASHHSRESDNEHHYVDDDEHHYVHDDDNEHDGPNFDPNAAINSLAAGYVAAHAPPRKNATSSANGKPASAARANSTSNKNSDSQKAAIKNLKGAAKAVSSVKKFLTANGMKFWWSWNNSIGI